MSGTAVLNQVVDALGYRDDRGYVDQLTGDDPRGSTWSDLREKCHVTAAFFKGAVPVIAFVAADSHQEALLAHRRLWNYGRVPILIAATADEVLALSCNTAPSNSNPEVALLERATPGEAVANILDDFTRFSIESGKLARRRSAQLDKQNRVDQSLLRNLRALRVRLQTEGVLQEEIEPLLGRTIFVRYLEDRQILGPEQLSELGQPATLAKALEEGWEAVAKFFAAMSEHFSGDVFRADALARPIPARALAVLSHFFHGGSVETGQTALWPYDFSIIPPELISSIYEQLLAEQQKDDAAYYTPRHVVDLVLDELLPPDSPETPDPTVLDPACGSGIFLTEAFRRLVLRRKRITHVTPDYDELERLLVGCIFGIDRNPAAIGVTAFGLYLALLEHVDPRTIWLRVQLPKLVGTNLIVSDFFEVNPLSDRTFDVIAGNPPWQSKLTAGALKFISGEKRRVPDRQVAVAFVWKTVGMLSASGAAGLVLPAKTFLHNRSGVAEQFRLEFFDQLDVQTIIDLSPLRKGLFGAATSPAVIAIYGTRTLAGRSHLLHVSPRRTPISEIIDGIAIPQQNIQRIAQSTARTNPWMWKTLLWGGPDDVALVAHLRESFYPLLAHARERGWSHGAGFQASGGEQNDASHLRAIPRIRTEDVAAMRPPTDLLPPSDAEFMHRPRKRDIFLAPHVLLRKGFAHTPIAAFASFNAAFPDGLFAIAGPANDARLLSAIGAILNSSLAHYWYFMTGSSWGVEREQVQLQEWLTLPVPRLRPAAIKELAEVSEMASSGKPVEQWRVALDEIVAREYDLTRSERQLLRDALQVRLSEYQAGPASDAYRAAGQLSLAAYVRALKEEMDGLELDDWLVEVTEERDDFIRVTCTHNDLPASKYTVSASAFTVAGLLREDRTVLNEALSSATIVEPQAVVLDGNRVHVVKPNRRACWTVSSAARDAADVFGALVAGHV